MRGDRARSPQVDERERSILADLIRPAAGERTDQHVSRLIKAYRSLPEILAADQQAIRRLTDDARVAEQVGAVRAAMLHCLESDLRERPLLASHGEAADFLRVLIAFEPNEKVAALFLDGSNSLLSADVIAAGTVDQVALYPREVCRRALNVGAAAVILGHNHPAGSLDPSDADRSLTRSIVEAAAALGIAVHDHIIVSRRGWRSMKLMGAL